MMPKPPEYVLECVKQAGISFYEHLDALDWPDDHPDAPAKEANIVLHVAHQLMQSGQGFHVYSEARKPRPKNGRTGRLDLLAANNEVAIALEAKCFGDIGAMSISVLADVENLQVFCPEYVELARGESYKNWWKNASSRWAFAVIASFRMGNEVAVAWESGSSRSLYEKDRHGFERLITGLKLKNAYRVAFKINEGTRWANCGHVYFLVAAFEIKNEP